jgi:hypothetical protein
MRPVPVPILKSLEAILEKRAISPAERAYYKKWLRYFLDLCAKYPVPEAPPERVRLFVDNLREKKQTLLQQNQAAHAVSLYFEMLRKGKIPLADSYTGSALESGTVAKTSSVPEPLQVRERSLSPPQAIPPTDPSPGQEKTPSSIALPQRQPWRRWEDGYGVTSASPGHGPSLPRCQDH